MSEKNNSLPSAKFILALLAMTVAAVVCYFILFKTSKPLDPDSIPVIGETVIVVPEPEPEQTEVIDPTQDSEEPVEEDVLTNTEVTAPILETQQEFPVLTIDAKGESAQLEQAKAAAAEAERFNQQKLSRLDDVLNDQSSELESLAKVEISYLVNRWRDAWAAGNTDSYLAFYSDNFVPENKQDFDQWQTKRRERVISSKSADIELSNFDVSFEENLTISIVEFDQHYVAGEYNDHSRKKLIFAKEALGWKLISEAILSQTQ